MKKTAKFLVTLVFCLTLISATFVPAFAASVAQVKGVKATSVTYNSATLTWTKASKVSGYEVENYNASTKKWKKVGSDIKSSANSLKLTKLKTGTTYKYRVRAFSKSLFGNKKTYGAYSSTVSVKPLPAKVTSFKASSLTATTAKLSWTKISGATGYTIKRYVNKKWTTFKTVKGANSLTLTGLAPGTTYQLRIAPYTTVSKKNIYGAYSSTLNVKPTVSKISGLKVSASATSATATWSKASDVTGYKIVLTDANKKTVLSKTTTKTSYSLTNLIPNAKYTLTVNAYKTVGKKTYSGSKATLTVTAKIAAPTALKASATATTVSGSYAKSTNAKNYVIFLYKDGKQFKKVTTTATTYKFTGLTPNASYYVKVAAYLTLSGKNYYSSYATSSTVKTSVAAPQKLSVSKIATTSLTLSWSKVADISSYEVQQYIGNTWVKLTEISATSYKAVGLKALTEYKFRVRSKLSLNGTTYPSAFTSTLTAKTGVVPVTGLVAEQVSETYVRLKWDGVNGADGYVISSPEIGTVDVTESKADITALKSNTDYTFTVNAYKKQGSTKLLSDDAKVSAKTIYIFRNSTDTSAYISNTKSTCVLRWSPIKNATYDVYKLVTGEGYQLVKDNLKDSFIEITDGQYFKATATKSGAYTKITWDNQNLPSGSKYTLEVASTTSKVWQKIGEYTGTSATVILAPNTNYVARVTASYTDRADLYKVVINSDDESVNGQRVATLKVRPEKYAVTSTFKTPAAAAFNSGNNENKTLYTLMLAQAITNTKHEQGKVNLKYKADISTELDKMKLGILTFNDPQKFADYINSSAKPGEEISFDEMFEDMEESIDMTGTAQNGALSFTESNGRKKESTLSSIVIPEGEYAYLYNANDINSFASKVKSIKVDSLSNGAKKITLVLAKESTSTKNSNTTNVHNGLAQGMAFSSQDLQGGEINFTVGDTVIVAEVNANYTLNSYSVKSPISMNAKMPTGTALGNLELYLSGQMVNDYKFTR